MPLRNPFRRNGTLDIQSIYTSTTHTLSTTSSASIAASTPTDVPEKEPVEYQLSEIDDNGTFLPPSPLATKPAFWHTKSNLSLTSSTNHRPLRNDDEHFSISRESFDSYRRSFDISARSPVLSCASSAMTRPSLDSSLFLAPPPLDVEGADGSSEEASGNGNEAEFEEVVLSEQAEELQVKTVAKKRGLFARFTMDVNEVNDVDAKVTGSKSGSGFQLFGASRKRAQSGQGAELKCMSPKGIGEVPVVVVEN